MTHIVGYTYDAQNWCPRHINDALPTGEGERFDGWALAGIHRNISAEDNLNEIAHAFGIDRSDEGSFDSSEFPKVITYQMEAADGFVSECAHDYQPLVETEG